MSKYKLGVLYGDGIGPEIVKSSVEVLKEATEKAANGTEFELRELPMDWGKTFIIGGKSSLGIP